MRSNKRLSGRNRSTDSWEKEMTRIVYETIHELISVADRHNIGGEAALQYYADLFSVMASISTFEHFTEGGETNEIQ